MICILAPPSLNFIGKWYHDFTQTEDQEVLDLLDKSEKMYCFKSNQCFLVILIIIFGIVPLIKSENSERIEQENIQDEFYMGVGKNPFWLKEQNFTLWLHIISMTISFGILIPIGIIL